MIMICQCKSDGLGLGVGTSSRLQLECNRTVNATHHSAGLSTEDHVQVLPTQVGHVSPAGGCTFHVRHTLLARKLLKLALKHTTPATVTLNVIHPTNTATAATP
jgi:hypothetical protein